MYCIEMIWSVLLVLLYAILGISSVVILIYIFGFLCKIGVLLVIHKLETYSHITVQKSNADGEWSYDIPVIPSVMIQSNNKFHPETIIWQSSDEKCHQDMRIIVASAAVRQECHSYKFMLLYVTDNRIQEDLSRAEAIVVTAGELLHVANEARRIKNAGLKQFRGSSMLKLSAETMEMDGKWFIERIDNELSSVTF